MLDCKYCGKVVREGVVADDGYTYHKQCLKKFDIEQYDLYVRERDFKKHMVKQLIICKSVVCDLDIPCRECSYNKNGDCIINSCIDCLKEDLK